MAQLAEAIPRILQRIFVSALVVCLVAWAVVLFVQLFSGKRRSCCVASPERGLGKPVWAGLAALAAVCTALCGKNTNGVQNVGGGQLFQFNPPLSQIVSPLDVSNGWRVAEETGAESFAQPSANAITNELWRRRGAFDDALRIPAYGWSYPYATGVTVLARGELRTGIRAHDFPRAFEQDFSLLPFVSWPLLPEGRRESVFWYDTTSSNTLLTTWWNAALGRDATNPVNFQAELFPDGGFTYRYEDRTVRHARVWPFDWDNDGLENTVDPDPLTPGPDAHGTNAEWYNAVCSNVFSAVIFEDAYEDRPGVTMPRRSTRVRLTIDAYGGPEGGWLWLTGANFGKLFPVEGGVALPHSQELAAGTTYHASGVYEGVVQSENELDISVSGSFYPNGQGETIENNARLTAVRILLLPYVDPPEDATSGRHRYGVGECVKQFQYPSVPTVTWNPVEGGSNLVLETGQPCYHFPLHACRNPLRIDLGDVSYVPLLRCIEPTGIVVRDVELCTFGLPVGKAGGIGLLQAFFVTPLTVSFSGIAVEEVPCDQGSVEGYFRYAVPSSLWSHTRDAGAGKWYDVSPSNKMDEDPDSKDMAAITNELFAITSDGTLTNDYSFGWMDGSMTWQIPFGWNARGTHGEAGPAGTFGGTTQEFYIDPTGYTGVRKFRNQATRRLDDKRFLNGIEVHNNVVK